MKIINLLIKILMLIWVYVFLPNLLAYSQDSRREIFANIKKSGGVNFAYPAPKEISTTPPPSGYEPFYISHFGRHGSRYLVNDDEYKKVLDVFEKANNEQILTPLGQNVFIRLKNIYNQVQGKGGELTPLGTSQVKEIAKRMFENYPDVFAQESKITAVSTTVGRCIRSMELFCNELKQNNGDLLINMDADERHMQYLNYHTNQAVQFRYASNTWRPDYEEFEEAHIKTDRLLSTLFLSLEPLGSEFNPRAFVFDLFENAGSLQNTTIDISLYDLFEKEELYNLWQCKNYRLYVQYGNAAINGGLMMENAKPLLLDILARADSVISDEGVGASFRFGHDGNIVPLAMLLHVEGTYNSVDNPQDYANFWNDFKVAPMAANIQMIFYRHHDSKDVLVSFFYNEQQVSVPPIKTTLFPYYKWSDVKTFYLSLLEQGNNLSSAADR